MMTREERKARVANFIMGSSGYLSIAEVARGAGLKKTPYLRDMLTELCDEGVIACTQHEFPNGTVGWLYIDGRALGPAE